MSTRSTTLERVAVDLRIGLRPVGGFIYGVVAYVVGFVGTVALFAWTVVQTGGVDLGDVTAGPTIEGTAGSVLAVLGWLFFTVHGVAIERVGATGTEAVDLFRILRVADTTVFVLLPAVLLFVAGFVVAHRAGGDLSPGATAVAGASIVVGYGLLVALSVVTFVVPGDTVTYRPALLSGIVVAGIVYPLVCGGAGGLARGLVGRGVRPHHAETRR